MLAWYSLDPGSVFPVLVVPVGPALVFLAHSGLAGPVHVFDRGVIFSSLIWSGLCFILNLVGETQI